MAKQLTSKVKSKRTSIFQMPSVQTMVSRKSSITNAFVNAVIPVVQPTEAEILEAISILGMDATDVRCAYCGDISSEWDHLRPLVEKQRPTGYISEIANLVPSCGKCNQSKGNKPWREWMLSDTKRSPTGRGIPDILERITRLEDYTKWKTPRIIHFEKILGENAWSQYWDMWNAIIGELNKCQAVAKILREEIAKSIEPNL